MFLSYHLTKRWKCKNTKMKTQKCKGKNTKLNWFHFFLRKISCVFPFFMFCSVYGIYYPHPLSSKSAVLLLCILSCAYWDFVSWIYTSYPFFLITLKMYCDRPCLPCLSITLFLWRQFLFQFLPSPTQRVMWAIATTGHPSFIVYLL